MSDILVKKSVHSSKSLISLLNQSKAEVMLLQKRELCSQTSMWLLG